MKQTEYLSSLTPRKVYDIPIKHISEELDGLYALKVMPVKQAFREEKHEWLERTALFVLGKKCLFSSSKCSGLTMQYNTNTVSHETAKLIAWYIRFLVIAMST